MATMNEIVATLWPKGGYTPWLVARARQNALQTYGVNPVTLQPYDVGALRESSGMVEVLTPAGWKAYIPQHHFIASLYNRVGPGWSWGSNSVHNSARAWFETIYGRRPKPMESVDIQFSKTLFETLRRIALDGSTEAPPVFEDATPISLPNPLPTPVPIPTPVPTPTPSPTPVPPQPVPVPTPQPTPGPGAGLPPLSPARVRAEEIRILLLRVPGLPQWLAWLLSGKEFSGTFLVPVIRGWRLWQKSLGDTREIPIEDR